MLLRFAVRYIGKFSVYLPEIKIQIADIFDFYLSLRLNQDLMQNYENVIQAWEVNINFSFFSLHFHNFARNLQFPFNYILCNTSKEHMYACTCTNMSTYNDSSYAQLYAALVANRRPSMQLCIRFAWPENYWRLPSSPFPSFIEVIELNLRSGPRTLRSAIGLLITQYSSESTNLNLNSCIILQNIKMNFEIQIFVLASTDGF